MATVKKYKDENGVEVVPDFYYCQEWKTWVLCWKDVEGNQVGDAEYFFRKSFLKKEIKERQKTS